jgi:hypothetical protein
MCAPARATLSTSAVERGWGRGQRETTQGLPYDFCYFKERRHLALLSNTGRRHRVDHHPEN